MNWSTCISAFSHKGYPLFVHFVKKIKLCFPKYFYDFIGGIFVVHEKKISGLNDKRFLIKIKLVSCTGVKSISMAFSV